MDLKQDLRCDTIDTREEYEMKVRGRTDARHKDWLAGTWGRRICRGRTAGRSGQEVCRRNRR